MPGVFESIMNPYPASLLHERELALLPILLRAAQQKLEAGETGVATVIDMQVQGGQTLCIGRHDSTNGVPVEMIPAVAGLGAKPLTRMDLAIRAIDNYLDGDDVQRAKTRVEGFGAVQYERSSWVTMVKATSVDFIVGASSADVDELPAMAGAPLYALYVMREDDQLLRFSVYALFERWAKALAALKLEFDGLLASDEPEVVAWREWRAGLASEEAKIFARF